MQFAVALERAIAAPRSKVYRAWLDPALLARWFGPDDMSVVDANVDERVGGAHNVALLGHHTAQETKLTITFSDAEGGGTALRLDHERITVEGDLNTTSVNVGWGQTLAKLQAFLESSSSTPLQQGEQS